MEDEPGEFGTGGGGDSSDPSLLNAEKPLSSASTMSPSTSGESSAGTMAVTASSSSQGGISALSGEGDDAGRPPAARPGRGI